MNTHFNKMIQVFIFSLIQMPSLSYAATHNETQLASQATPTKVTYKITDGYGEYTGSGTTKIEASAQAREACISNKIAAFEAKTGATPDPDTADLFIDACINK